MDQTIKNQNSNVCRLHGVDIVVLTDPAQAKPYKNEWNRLAKENTTHSIFQTYEWHECWWKTYGDLFQGLILTAWTEDRALTGVAPLMVSDRRVGFIRQRVVAFIGAPAESDYAQSDYSDFLVDPDHPHVLNAFMDWLMIHGHLWDVLHFSDIPDTSCHLEILEKVMAGTSHHLQKTCLYEAPTCIFSDPDEALKIPRKKSLKRHFNYFNRMGELKFQHCTSLSEIERHFPLFFAQHIGRRALAGDSSQFKDTRQKNFFMNLSKAFVSTPWLRFSVVLFNGRPIAYHLGFIFGGRFVWYKPTFDVSWKKHSPGEVLIKYLFEYALEQQVDEFDFTIGKAAFKHRFATHIRHNFRLSLFRYGVPFFGQKCYNGIKTAVKSNPIFESKARGMLNALKKQAN